MRKKIVAGNWKMHKTLSEGEQLILDMVSILNAFPDGFPENFWSGRLEIVVAPPFTHLALASELLMDTPVRIAAQDCSAFAEGAYTGEVSASMLRSAGAAYVIIGHSERRQHHDETEKLLRKKIQEAIESELSPILCCGETIEERRNLQQQEVVKKQLEGTLFSFNAREISSAVIAYEPVWAIGTGETATPTQAAEMHTFIRGLLRNKYGSHNAENIPILYGGSCKPGNARSLFEQPDVDGGLIGGASLNASDFFAIVKCMVALVQKARS